MAMLFSSPLVHSLLREALLQADEPTRAIATVTWGSKWSTLRLLRLQFWAVFFVAVFVYYYNALLTDSLGFKRIEWDMDDEDDTAEKKRVSDDENLGGTTEGILRSISDSPLPWYLTCHEVYAVVKKSFEMIPYGDKVVASTFSNIGSATSCINKCTNSVVGLELVNIDAETCYQIVQAIDKTVTELVVLIDDSVSDFRVHFSDLLRWLILAVLEKKKLALALVEGTTAATLQSCQRSIERMERARSQLLASVKSMNPRQYDRVCALVDRLVEMTFSVVEATHQTLDRGLFEAQAIVNTTCAVATPLLSTPTSTPTSPIAILIAGGKTGYDITTNRSLGKAKKGEGQTQEQAQTQTQAPTQTQTQTPEQRFTQTPAGRAVICILKTWRPYIHSFLLFCDPVLKALAKPAEKFFLPYWVRMKGVSSCGIGTMCCAVEERVLVVVKIIDVYCDLSDHFDIDITYKPTNTSDSSSDQ